MAGGLLMTMTETVKTLGVNWVVSTLGHAVTGRMR